MTNFRLEYLFDRYISNICSPEEEAELMNLLNQQENDATIQILIDQVIQKTEHEAQMPEQVAVNILERILRRNKAPVAIKKNNSIFSFPWMKVAAVIIVFAGFAVWSINRETRPRKEALSVMTSPVLPGGNRAILVMADGSRFELNNLQNSNIPYEEVNISNRNGQLTFNSETILSSSTNEYNTLITPRGGQYKVQLSDGSMIWLNASSTIRFPSVFNGKNREIELSGEAYFEVAKNKEMPFEVKVGNMKVKVLGTKFSISGYKDDDFIRTSLLEGSVKIVKGNETDLLKPGQEGIVTKAEDKVRIKETNTEEVIAWKNGLFLFEGADITTIMKQIGRWYNVEIVYEGAVPARRFEGKISRDAPLADVLKILELSDLNISSEGKKIIVR